MFKLLTTFLILLVWPLSFLLNNYPKLFLICFTPAVLYLISFYFFKKNKPVWMFIIPLVLIYLFYFNFGFKNPRENSIFYYDETAIQKINMQSQIYPRIWLSRMFQNKPSIYLNRFSFNFFALTDPSNYFFGFHPREIAVENQNLQKFPFLSSVFFLIGLYYLPKNPNLKFILLSLLPPLILLSFSKNFDRYDLVLYFPLLLITLSGLNSFSVKISKYKLAFLTVFLILSTLELLHLITAALK